MGEIVSKALLKSRRGNLLAYFYSKICGLTQLSLLVVIRKNPSPGNQVETLLTFCCNLYIYSCTAPSAQLHLLLHTSESFFALSSLLSLLCEIRLIAVFVAAAMYW